MRLSLHVLMEDLLLVIPSECQHELYGKCHACGPTHSEVLQKYDLRIYLFLCLILLMAIS